jgi:rfaE bifunctional protein nucleotidyltransferase chain/domain/rfaE bifunctional protein kinase chain/domain
MRLVVVGDTLLDRDVTGAADRVCPDAPALVLTERNTMDRPGGAGLAALLAAGRGHEVTLLTALADDAGGARLSQLLHAAGITVYPLPLPGATPEKIRLRAGRQVLLRLDRGGAPTTPGQPSGEALAALAGAAAVLVSDYGRGVAAVPALRAALAESAAPVVWDPHPRGSAAVPGARLVTPNEAEVAVLTRGIGAAASGGRRLAAATRAAQDLRGNWRAGAVAVTLGADGALLCHAGPTPLVVPAPVRADGDSCGAGDRFAASAALALASGALVSEAVEAAVAEAAEFVATGGAGGFRPGTASQRGSPVPGNPGRGEPSSEFPPERGALSGDGREVAGREVAGALVADVRARGGTVVASGGCFDLLHAGHVATLEAARRLGDCLVVCVNSDASVARIKGPERPLVPQADRLRVLRALSCVDEVVVFDESTPDSVLSWLRPDIWVKGGDYGDGTTGRVDLPEAELVRRWGGQTVIVPYLAGRSTTGIIAAASRRNGNQSAPAGVGNQSAPAGVGNQSAPAGAGNQKGA